MSSASEITPASTEAQALQDAIQKDLIQRGYSVEGDEVMAEFIFVMLCNHKKPEQINGELADLIGPDFDPLFTVWLFQAVKQHFPESKQAQESAPAAPPAAASTATQATVPPPSDLSPTEFRYAQTDQRGASRSQPRNDPFGLYNKAISGVKRPYDGTGRDERSQRARVDGPPLNAPTGPKNPQPMDGHQAGGPPRREQRLMDRVGPPPGTIPVMSPMGPALYNPQSGSFVQPDFGQRGTGNRRRGESGSNQQQQQQQQQMMFQGAVPFFIPPGMMPQFPQGGMFPPQMFAQFQAHQAAQAGQMGQSGGPSSNGFGAFAPGAPQQGMSTTVPKPIQEVPTKPTDDSLCKYATECKNAYCKFAHPSPAATKESGLVLSEEACEKQLECADPDCPKSHISPQAKDPANSRAPPAHESAGIPRPPKHSAFNGGAAAGGKPCKFGASCTRQGCVFTHPWDKASTPCRFGSACTRPDCHFTHPSGHNPYRPRSFGPPKGNRSAVFNTASDRLKKFAVQEGETEKIIPGQPEAEMTEEKAPKQENGEGASTQAAEIMKVKREEA